MTTAVYKNLNDLLFTTPSLAKFVTLAPFNFLSVNIYFRSCLKPWRNYILTNWAIFIPSFRIGLTLVSFGFKNNMLVWIRLFLFSINCLNKQTGHICVEIYKQLFTIRQFFRTTLCDFRKYWIIFYPTFLGFRKCQFRRMNFLSSPCQLMWNYVKLITLHSIWIIFIPHLNKW